MRKISLFFFFFVCTACCYKCGLKDDFVRRTVDIPYVQGDVDGQLTASLIYQISSSGCFEYKRGFSDYQLHAEVISLNDDRIGFKRDNIGCKNCKKEKNLMAIENRETIAVRVRLKSASTGKEIWGPKIITADIDYDYFDQDSLKDMSFIDMNGNRQSILFYSLGQLESISSAQDSALRPLFKKLSENIVSALIGEIKDLDY